MHTTKFLTIVNDAKKAINEMTLNKLAQLQANNTALCLIDVREKNEWINGHLPHAIHLSKGVIERDIEQLIPDIDTLIVLYCGGGFRSALAAENLQRMGYTNIFSLAGGYGHWIQQQTSTITSHTN